MHRYVRTRAFTLIEILVAMGIFVVIAVLVSGLIHSVFNTESRLRAYHQAFMDYKIAILLFQSDVRQAIDYPILDAQQVSNPAVEGNIHSVSLTVPSQENQAEVLRVKYTFSDHQWIRSLCHVTANFQSSCVEAILMSSIDQGQLAYLDEQHHFQETWPKQHKQHMPLAIQLTLSAPPWGTSTQLIPFLGSSRDYAD